ncbi:P-loop NTPase [candidate division WOR-3 bacterium]|nr:P-loop NTPase [candidate division WOR-3 bacterium]
MDPRLNVIDERLSGVEKIIAVSGGKGGVGKSSVSSMLALIFNDMRKKVGLLDLDLSGPSDNVILGVKDVFPEEKKGLIPPVVSGMKFMSIVYFARENPLTFRGKDYSNAIIELLAITRWGGLDYLIIDMPPGIGDTALEIIKVVKNIEFIMVGNQSKLTLETLKKVIRMSKEAKKKIIGVIENMAASDIKAKENKLASFGVPFLGRISFDEKYESSLGNLDKLLKTGFAKDLKKIVSNNPEVF